MIPGLTIIPDYLTHDDQVALTKTIDAQPWMADLKRRVQHYGYKYDYRARAIDETMRLGTLPDWATTLAERLHKQRYITAIPDQVIVNEYQPGQGIEPHVDCVPCFDDTILSLSLGSTCLMDFYSLDDHTKQSRWLEAGSLLIMTGVARYQWKHGIAPRKTDTYKGQKFCRARRISLTFRRVIAVPA